MNARDRLYKRKAASRAREYAAMKRGYVTREEKRAFQIAEKLRREEWRSGLAALDAGERAARLRAFGVFKRRVFLCGLFARKPRAALAKPVPNEDGHIM